MLILDNIKAYLLNPIIVLMFGIALILFLYGMVEYLYQGNVGKNQEKAVQNIIWGAVGMAIMVSVFGIMNVITSTISSLMGK